ncbi:EAL domain-containing protein, partial [Blastococcus sp. CCUG 61487]|uniref:EAL domain-containing protein n=1 Tax=Blastococcus sp. CCUG 61487 TaxID=1840703 RepID=UPI001BB04A48
MLSDPSDSPAEALDRALGGAVHSVFQPIVDLDSGAVVAYEALARGPVAPSSGPTRCSPPRA